MSKTFYISACVMVCLIIPVGLIIAMGSQGLTPPTTYACVRCGEVVYFRDMVNIRQGGIQSIAVYSHNHQYYCPNHTVLEKQSLWPLWQFRECSSRADSVKPSEAIGHR